MKIRGGLGAQMLHLIFEVVVEKADVDLLQCSEDKVNKV
jgi:hypothetical protein